MHFCAAAIDGDVFTTRERPRSSGRWHARRLSGHPVLAAISCSSARLCVTIDQMGDIYSSTAPGAGRWHLHRAAAFGARTVSCDPAGLCIAPRSRSYYVTTHPANVSRAWGRVSLPRRGTLDIACRSRRLCVGVTWNGFALSTSDPMGGLWQSQLVDGHDSLTAVSCPAVGFCIAADSAGDILSSTDPSGGAAAWRGFRVDRRNLDIGSISCPTSTLCVAAGFGGVLTSSDPGGGPGAWHWSEIDGDHGLAGVNCPSSSLCVAVDNDGSVFTSTDPADGAAAWSGSALGRGILQTVTCASAALCLIGEDGGRVLSSTDPTGGASAWHQATLPDPNSQDVLGASCPSTQLCVVIDRGGLYASTNPAGAAPGWAYEGAPFGEAELGGVDCSSVTMCTAFAGSIGSSDGALITSTAPASQSWTVTAKDPTAAVTGMSCQPNTTTCLAVDDAGQVLTSR